MGLNDPHDRLLVSNTLPFRCSTEEISNEQLATQLATSNEQEWLLERYVGPHIDRLQPYGYSIRPTRACTTISTVGRLVVSSNIVLRSAGSLASGVQW